VFLTSGDCANRIVQFLHYLIVWAQVLFDSPNGDGTYFPQIGEQSMNGVATKVEWFT
jgi:hypothetical protein